MAQPANSQENTGARSRGFFRFGIASVAPDLALAVAGVTLFYCLFLYQGQRQFFRDSDTGWHIRNGERMLDTATLPRIDPYSFSKPGEPWYAWEWGADLAMGWTHRHTGLRGVAFLFAVAVASAVWLWIRLHWALGGNFLLVCLFLPPMVTTTSLHWLARPHVFGWLFLLGAVWMSEKAPVRFRAWHAAVIGAAAILWTNVHASFFLGAVVPALYAAGFWLRPLIWDSDFFLDRQRAGWLGKAALAAFLASFANPYGWKLHLHLLSYLADTELLARVAEFQSFNFHAEGAWQVLATLILCALGCVVALAARQPGRALVCIFLTLVAVRSARGLPVAALAVLPLTNASLVPLLWRFDSTRMRARELLDGALLYGDGLRRLDARFNGLLLAPQILLLAALCLALPDAAARVGFDPESFPVTAAPQIARLPGDARIFSSDKFGGYLIYRFSGARKVFFDGRSDFYGADFMKQYLRLVEARPGWRQIWNQYHFTHALTARDATLTATFDAAGWKRLYADRTVVLFEVPPEK